MPKKKTDWKQVIGGGVGAAAGSGAATAAYTTGIYHTNRRAKQQFDDYYKNRGPAKTYNVKTKKPDSWEPHPDRRTVPSDPKNPNSARKPEQSNKFFEQQKKQRRSWYLKNEPKTWNIHDHKPDSYHANPSPIDPNWRKYYRAHPDGPGNAGKVLRRNAWLQGGKTGVAATAAVAATGGAIGGAVGRRVARGKNGKEGRHAGTAQAVGGALGGVGAGVTTRIGSHVPLKFALPASVAMGVAGAVGERKAAQKAKGKLAELHKVYTEYKPVGTTKKGVFRRKTVQVSEWRNDDGYGGTDTNDSLLLGRNAKKVKSFSLPAPAPDSLVKAAHPKRAVVTHLSGKKTVVNVINYHGNGKFWVREVGQSEAHPPTLMHSDRFQFIKDRPIAKSLEPDMSISAFGVQHEMSKSGGDVVGALKNLKGNQHKYHKASGPWAFDKSSGTFQPMTNKQRKEMRWHHAKESGAAGAVLGGAVAGVMNHGSSNWRRALMFSAAGGAAGAVAGYGYGHVEYPLKKRQANVGTYKEQKANQRSATAAGGVLGAYEGTMAVKPAAQTLYRSGFKANKMADKINLRTQGNTKHPAYAKWDKLNTLATHPGTPEHEAASARGFADKVKAANPGIGGRPLNMGEKAAAGGAKMWGRAMTNPKTAAFTGLGAAIGGGAALGAGALHRLTKPSKPKPVSLNKRFTVYDPERRRQARTKAYAATASATTAGAALGAAGSAGHAGYEAHRSYKTVRDLRRARVVMETNADNGFYSGRQHSSAKGAWTRKVRAATGSPKMDRLSEARAITRGKAGKSAAIAAGLAGGAIATRAATHHLKGRSMDSYSGWWDHYGATH